MPAHRDNSSESLGTDERIDQVEQDAERHDRAQRVIESHRGLLKTVAGIGVGDRHSDHRNPGCNKKNIKHEATPADRRM